MQKEKTMPEYKILLSILVLSWVITGCTQQDDSKVKFLDFPEGYDRSFTHYHTMNRAGEEKVAKMFANSTALQSLRDKDKAGYGSVIVMEIYKPELDNEGNAIVGENSIYKTDELAAIAVMEKRKSWPQGFPDSELLGKWGFTIFKPDMTPTHKPGTSDNTSCVSCHTPLEEVQDSLFTYKQLVEYSRKNP